MKGAERIAPRNQIIRAYVLALGPGDPLPAVWATAVARMVMPDVSEAEIFDAVRHAIRESNRSGAKFEREQVRRADRQDDDYDATDDMWRSYDDCLAAVRERVAGGGKTWEPR